MNMMRKKSARGGARGKARSKARGSTRCGARSRARSRVHRKALDRVRSKGTSEKRVLLRQLRRSLLAVPDGTVRSGVPRFLALHCFSEVPKVPGETSGASGASIVIALILVAAITFFTIGITSTAITALHTTNYSKKALQAEYAAQSAVESVKRELASMEMGAADSVVDQIIPVSSDPLIYAEYDILTADDSLDTKYGVYRSVPVKKTGNAGDECNNLSMSAVSSHNHPCNWNKIYYGDSVSIPLYTVSESGGSPVYKNPGASGLNISNMFLYVRTPCSDGTNTASCERYTVDSIPLEGTTEGKVIVSWQIDGECNGYSCGVTQILDPSGTSAFQTGRFPTGMYYFNFCSVTVQDLYGFGNDGKPLQGTGSAFFNGELPWTGNNLNKPVLKLSYVTAATSGGEPIPYLEYQVYYYASGGPLAASFRVSVDGFSEGFKYSLNGVQSMEGDVFDFAVQN